MCIFQDGYEYSENIANIELADETDSFTVIKSEPSAFTDDDFSTTVSLPDDDEAGYESIELDSDTLNEILLNDMEYEAVSVENTSIYLPTQLIRFFLHFNIRRIINFREALPRKTQMENK